MFEQIPRVAVGPRFHSPLRHPPHLLVELGFELDIIHLRPRIDCFPDIQSLQRWFVLSWLSPSLGLVDWRN